MTFYEKLSAAWREADSMLCVGLDPELDRIPLHLQSEAKPFLTFNRAIVDATAPFACAFKPQFAHYAAEGRLDELAATIDHIRERHPSKVIILDAKRGDIGNTARLYAREAFDHYGADAVTVNPYMGGDTLAPFTDYTGKGTIVLCRTSNLGSGEIQTLRDGTSGEAVYETVARLAAGPWNVRGNLALVVGATYPDELTRVRALVGNMPLLVPGVGAQGGDLQAVLRAGRASDGYGMLINSSRGIIFAGFDEDFAKAAAEAARELAEAMRMV